MRERQGGGGARASRGALVLGCVLLGSAVALSTSCNGEITAANGGPPGALGTGGTGGNGSGGGADGGSGGGSDGGSLLSSELPCAAYDVLSVYCWTCHGSQPSGGAPQSLVTLAELQASSPGYAGQSNGTRCAVRMQSTSSPMPPPPAAAVPSADSVAFQSWVSAGMPAGTCVSDGGTPPPPPDAGPPDPLDAQSTCTSNSNWTLGTRKSADMEPGHACITCHQQSGGPTFTVAGTVYPTGHEPDDCNGSGAAGAVVTVKDSNGATATFTAYGPSGNFHGNSSLRFPITATVTFNGKVRAMSTPVSTGDCNSCHTQTGASGAPGRVTLPP